MIFSRQLDQAVAAHTNIDFSISGKIEKNCCQLIAHLSLPWSIGWVALSFLVRRSFVCSFVVPLWWHPNKSPYFSIYTGIEAQYHLIPSRGGICPCRHCRRQCKIFASGVNFSIFTHFLCFFLLKLLKLGEIDGVKFLAWKSGGVKFWTNSMSAFLLDDFARIVQPYSPGWKAWDAEVKNVKVLWGPVNLFAQDNLCGQSQNWINDSRARNCWKILRLHCYL